MKNEMTTLCIIVLLITSGCGVKFHNTISLEKTLNGVIIDSNGYNVNSQELLDTDYLLLYFSAHWCPPCQAFTPKLVDFYNTHGGGQLFNAVFISNDHSKTAMFDHMRETRMPWPALQYKSIAAKTLNKTYSGDGIPRLVLINPKGDILADCFKGREYLGPDIVLEKLKVLLTKRKNDPVGISDSTGKHLPTPEKLTNKYTINGFGNGSKQDVAIINGKFTTVGAELDKGVVVKKITPTYVEISYEGNHYRLHP